MHLIPAIPRLQRHIKKPSFFFVGRNISIPLVPGLLEDGGPALMLWGWRRWTWMWLSGEAPTMLEGNRGGPTFQVVEFHGVRSALTRWFLLFIFIYHFNSFHFHRHIFSNCKIVGTDACGTFVWLVERFRGNLCRCFRLRLPWNSAIFSTRTPGLALPKIQTC